MSIDIVARTQTPTGQPSNPDALDAAIAQQRQHVVHLEALVSLARDACLRADAELDAAIRRRNRAIWSLGELLEEHVDAEISVP